MIAAKQLADLITLSRGLLWIVLTWIGLVYGRSAVPAVCLIMLYSWFSDLVDGSIARRSRIHYHTWLGDHDLEVDMSVAAGLLVYLSLAGYFQPLFSAAYVIFWALLFKRFGLLRSYGMLFQAPVYGAIIWIALVEALPYGLFIVGFLVAAIIFTWPRFPNEVIPGFLMGLKKLDRSP